MSHIYRSPWGPVNNLPETTVFSYLWSNPHKISDDATALIDGETGRKISRRELRESSQRLAHGLVHGPIKAREGEVVCVFGINSVHYYEILFAIQCAALVCSPANVAYSVAELKHQLSDSGSTILFCHPSVLEVAHAAAKSAGWSEQQLRERIVLAVPRSAAGSAKNLTLDDVASKNDLLQPVRVKDVKTEVAYLCFSSGTTSAAKGVETTHHNMTSVLNQLGPFQATDKDVAIAVLPLSHIYGLTKLVHWPILIGMPVVVMPKFELVSFLKTCEKFRVSVVLLVPPVALLLAREKIVADYDLSSFRLIVSGAAPLGANLELELAERLKPALVRQAYGMTESSPTTHLCSLDKATPGAIGYLLPNVEGRIVDPVTFKDVKVRDELMRIGLTAKPGEEGEIWMRGPCIMKGYHNKPKETDETLVEREAGKGPWLRTGDVAYVKDDAFYICDRIKELIKYKGFQVPPAELEALLIGHPKVKDAAVIGVYSEVDATEFPRAYVVPADLAAAQRDPSAFEKELQAYIAKNAAPHKRLRGGVRVIEAVNKSPSGKILRRTYKEIAKKDPVVREARL